MSPPPSDPPSSSRDLFDDPAVLAHRDAAAMDDLLGARIVRHDAVLAWLDGWNGGPPLDAAPLATAPADPGGRPMVWTETAIGDSETIRRYLAMVSQGAVRRLAEAIALAVRRLAEDASDLPPGIADHPLLPPFLIRVHADLERIAILGIRQSGASRIL